jgi:hypothetical protein
MVVVVLVLVKKKAIEKENPNVVIDEENPHVLIKVIERISIKGGNETVADEN